MNKSLLTSISRPLSNNRLEILGNHSGGPGLGQAFPFTMMLGSLIHLFSLAAAVTVSSSWNITPTLEAHITVHESTISNGSVTFLKVINGGHSQLTINKNLRDGKVTFFCFGSCAAYVKYYGGNASYDWRRNARLENPGLGEVRKVLFMLGGAETDMKSLEKECWYAQKRSDHKHPHTLYTISFPVDQEESVDEAVTVPACPYFGSISPIPGVGSGLKASREVDPNEPVACLKVSNGHGQLTIIRKFTNGNIIASCSGNCVAYVKRMNGYNSYIDDKETIFPKIKKNRVEEVSFILGGARTNVDSLNKEFKAAQNQPDYKHPHTLYTIPFPVDQEGEEGEEVKDESK